MKRILSQANGITETFSRSGDTYVIQKLQDCEPILESNKVAYNAGIDRKSEMRRVASIPLSICEKWRIEKGINVFNKHHWPQVRRLLNDPEYRFLRTAPGRV